MPIRVQCSCGRAFPVADARAGQKEFCPMCGVQCVVPAAESRGLGRIAAVAGGTLLLAGAGFGAYWYFGRTADDASSTNSQGGSTVSFGEAPDAPRTGNGGPIPPTPRDPGPRNPTPTGLPADVARRAQERIAELGSDDESVRGAAVRELIEMGPDVEPLVRQAAGRGVAAARLVLRAFAWRRELPPEVQTKFATDIDVLISSTDASRAAVIKAWILRGESGCAPLLSALVEDDSAEVRVAAIEAAVRFHATVAGAGIDKVLADPGHTVLGVLAAGVFGAREAAPRIRPMLRDLILREIAVTALGLLRDQESTGEIAKDLAAADPRARARAYEAIGRIGRFPGGFPIDAIRDPDAQVRAAVFVAAGRCGEDSLQNSMAQLLAESDPRMRRAGAEALGALGQDTSIPNLMPLLTDTDAGVRYEAARALGRLRHRGSVALIVGLLEDRAVAEGASDDAALRSLLGTQAGRDLGLSVPAPAGREVREGALLALEECTGERFEGSTVDERVTAARAWWARAQPEYVR